MVEHRNVLSLLAQGEGCVMPGMHLYLSKTAERDLKLLCERWGVGRSRVITMALAEFASRWKETRDDY